MATDTARTDRPPTVRATLRENRREIRSYQNEKSDVSTLYSRIPAIGYELLPLSTKPYVYADAHAVDTMCPSTCAWAMNPGTASMRDLLHLYG